MAKTEEELKERKDDRKELSKEELEQVTGGKLLKNYHIEKEKEELRKNKS